MSEPRVYVACLACYNEGHLPGRWMDKDDLETWWDNMDEPFLIEDETALKPLCFRHLEEFDREEIGVDDNLQMEYAITYTWNSEWAIHASEHIPTKGEHPDIPILVEVMGDIEEHGAPYIAYVNLKGGLEEASVDDFYDRYNGEWKSPRELAYEYVEDTGMLRDVDETVCQYFDYDLFGTHMLQEMTEVDGYLFRQI